MMGRYGDKARNADGQMVVDFATRMKMAVENTYFKKSYTWDWTLRKKKINCTVWRDRDTKRARTYNRSE